MDKKVIESSETPIISGGYAEAILVANSKECLFISGQIPVDSLENIPRNFEDQARLVWNNVKYLLAAADMDYSNIVKHTTYLASRKYKSINSRVRQEILGENKSALTVVIAEIYDDKWLLEVDVIAMS